MGTFTPGGLYKPSPTPAETNWGAKVNTNFDRVDDFIGINVKANGVTGNGSTDDTAAIQAVIDAVGAVGSRYRIFFPPGVYKTTSTIAIKYDNIWLDGPGFFHSAPFDGSSTAGAIIDYHGASNTGPIIDWSPPTAQAPTPMRGGGITNLTLQGNNLANRGLLMRCCFKPSFTNVRITECQVAGFDLNDYNESVGFSTANNCWMPTFYNCQAFNYNAAGIGIRAGTSTSTQTFSGATHAMFYSTSIYTLTGAGIELSTCDDMWFFGYHIASGGSNNAIELRGRDPLQGWQKGCTDSAFFGGYVSGPVYCRVGDGSGPSSNNTFYGINYTHDAGTDDTPVIEQGATATVITTHGWARGVRPGYKDQTPPIVDDFVTGTSVNGQAQIGQLGWNTQQGSTGTIGYTSTVSGHPGIVRLDTGATSGNAVYICLGPNGTGMIWADEFFDLTYVIRAIQGDANCQIRVGLNASGSGDPSSNGIYYEKLYADTDWWAVNRYAGSQNRVDTATAVAANTWITLRVRRERAGGIEFFVNGALLSPVRNSNNVPTGIGLQPFLQIKNQTSSSQQVDIDVFTMTIDGLNRT